MLARLLKPIRLDRLDGRSHVGIQLRKHRDELLDHLGGKPSATEALLVEEIAKAAIITQAVGLWLLEQQSLVKGRQAHRRRRGTRTPPEQLVQAPPRIIGPAASG